MTDWDLSKLKQKTKLVDDAAIICDFDGLSPIVELSHSALTEQQKLKISLAGYIEEAPWLSANLTINGASEGLLQCELKKQDRVSVNLLCARSPSEEEVIAASTNGFHLSVTLQVRDAKGQSQNLRIEISNPRLQTLAWQSPIVELKQPTIPEISRLEAEGSDQVELFKIVVKQPVPLLEYGRQTPEAHISGRIVACIAGEFNELTSVLEGASEISKSEVGVSCDLHAGSDYSLPCTASIKDLFDAADGQDNLLLKFDWTCDFRNIEHDPLFGTHQFDLSLRQGELLALNFQNSSMVPNMTRELTATTERFPLEFSVPISGGAVQFEMGDKIEFDVEFLDDSWDFSAHAHLQETGVPLKLDEDAHFNLMQNVSVDRIIGGKLQIPLDEDLFDVRIDSEQYQLIIRFEAQRIKLNSATALLEDDDLFERKFSTIVVDIILRQTDPKFLICLDYGASAIGAWLGRVERNLVRQLIPLGSFAYSLAGAHSEYDPNKKSWQNALLPSSIGLNPNCHLRSRKAPLSYGNLSMVGSKLYAAEKRMAEFERTYDISLPVDLDFLNDNENTELMDLKPVVIPDFKRAIMSAENDLTYRLKQSVLERTANGLHMTREIDLQAFAADVFHELGSYLIPNALFHAHDEIDGPNSGEMGDERYDQWLEYADNDMQIVITHPSGIAQSRQLLYKNAGKNFAAGITGSQKSDLLREPKLVPEALAAAYFGISRTHYRGEGTEIFACIDIGASTVDASLIEAKMRHDTIESWTVFAHFGATIGGANLDDALLTLLVGNLREFFASSDDGVHGLELDHHFARDDALRAALLPRIQLAKRNLSETLVEKTSKEGLYDWARNGNGSSFQVELNDIVRSVVSGQPMREGEYTIPDSDDKVKLIVRPNVAGGQSVVIEVNSDLLDANEPIENPSRANPQTVSRTLGHAVPAMLIREARRLGVKDPKWVLTGRASLWPSIFSGVRHTAQAFGQDKDMAPFKPFSADDMKNATVFGAARLATSGLEVTDGVDHSYALVLHDDGREAVSEIEYLDTRSRSNGKKSVRFLPNRWLSRVLPGLDVDGVEEDISRNEIISLFGIFGQKVIVDQCQVKPGGVAGGSSDQLVDISWKHRNSEVEFKVGDVTVRQARNRLAGQ